MQKRLHSFRRNLVHLVGVAAAAVIWLGAHPASACPVTVEPAGAVITGNLKPNTAAVFVAGGTTVSCNTSTTSGLIPEAPDNTGCPVTGVLTPPSFSNCNVGSTSTNDTNGDWTLGISMNGQATLHIPQAGARTTILTCTITVCPGVGGCDVPAAWSNGPPGMLCINNASLPISRSGFFCPSVSTATFSACFNITSNEGDVEVIE